MAETKNVFISWSGPRSKSAAEALKEWLPLVVPTANPWMSATDIDKGTRWREEVATALDTMKAGVICLTPENLTAEWLLFEAGALSKTRDPKTRVWTYLLAGLSIPDLTDPLAMFNATKAEEEDTRKLVHSINTNLDPTVPESRVNRLFDKFWPDLKKELDAIPVPSGASHAKRSSDELAEESLVLLRAVAPLIQDIAAETEINRTNRLLQEEFRNAVTHLRSGDNLGAAGTVVNYFADTNIPWVSLNRVISTPTQRDHVTTEASAKPVPASGTEPKPSPSSPGRKMHAPSTRRKHVSPGPKPKV